MSTPRSASSFPFVTILALIAVMSCVGVCALNPERRQARSSVLHEAHAPNEAHVVEAFQPPAILPAWEKIASADAMSGDLMVSHVAQSENFVSFGFPYEGQQPLNFIARKANGRTEVLILVERGQFTCGVRGCPVSLRFDDLPVMQATGESPRDHASNILFLEPAKAIAAKLEGATTMRVQATFYREGDHVFEFDVRGFEGL